MGRRGSVIEGQTGGRPDLEGLRDAIEQHDPDLLLGFYADDAELRVVNGGSAQGPAFELRGKAEIERYLRVVSGQRMPSRIGGESVGEDLIVFREVCEYPDGVRVVVETTLELRGSKIVGQVDVVVREEDGDGGARGSQTDKTID
jgi:hypothetical protein